MVARLLLLLFAPLVSLCLFFVPPAAAARCGDGPAGFPVWLEAFKREAPGHGLKGHTVEAALAGVTYDPQVVRLDRSQKSFKLSFEQFYARRVDNAMIARGQRLARDYAGLLGRIEKTYGVPPAVLIAIWGLETGYGANSGKMSVLRSLATLAYDCRRSAFFTNELVAALKIVQRGDMAPAEMRGAWAGEIGQTQFLASSYLNYAVDGDRDGRRDLIRSVPDVLASTANYLKAKGWRAGQPWGPGTANHAVLKEWNRAEVYVKTIAVMAEKIGR
ncbi:lytic murein transglycosylase [Polymorphum gilvum]|uniref:Lytic murein transglycosylase n=1 Tax=Polymorphum gilvum (strain LMG 25793 / CGMCC 1.9160 / SL003B-26A1) TaxID=991905 RepID=F2J6U9_POLGS|nr:lytic murein transglycosylase [Polymorphum gilvum]ADZ72582.1 Lytic murein transglycosylase [Polymorphum gilvum SL003B-26A1]